IGASAESALKRAWIFAVAALGACQQTHERQTEARISRQSLAVRSTVDGIRIASTSLLPQNRRRTPVNDYCSSYVVPRPRTVGGQLVVRKGWIVTSETKLGNYDAVTFVGALDPSTSATCAHVDGNLAIFDGGNLKALVYERPPSKDKANDSSL